MMESILKEKSVKSANDHFNKFLSASASSSLYCSVLRVSAESTA